MAVIRSTDLDFDQIKENLKTYLEQQDEFSDYDFEASGLSNILDVLAYNTHVNGLIANLGINEAFLSSAQLRSSVVSHADALGYAARSRTGASASVNLSIATSNTTTTTVTIPRYTEFTTSIDDISYTFQTLETYIATNNGSGLFTVRTSAGSTQIPIYEGVRKTKTFIVGELEDNQFYVIPDENMDTSTVNVTVFDTITSSSFTPYVDVNSVARINPDSTVYILRETPNGYYEITFSDGNTLGQRPVSGNKIVVEYLQTNGPAANNGRTFVANEQVTIDGEDYDLTTTLVSRSAGGAEKESIQSIKQNAPLSFAAQQRLVTAEDYKALILSNFSSTIEDVAAWGGQDNVPPRYGNVFVSLKFVDGLSDEVQQTVKNNIVTSLTDNLAVMSIDTIFTDPTTTFLVVETTFNFDPDLSGSSLNTVETSIQNLVLEYFDANLNRFDTVFRRSNLLSAIDDFSPAILNSRMVVKAQQRLTPTLNFLTDYTIDFPMQIANPDDVNLIIESSRFTFSGQTCLLRNQLNTNKLQIVTTGGSVLKDNAGSYDPARGIVNIRGVNIEAFEGTAIKINVVPANQSTIKPLRNYIIGIDPTLSFAQGVIDFQNTASVIT
mgnify:CR=1 FL=1